MSGRKKKPQWWQVYVMLPLLAGLFVLEIRLGLNGTANILAQLGILFLVYAFMHLWLRTNRRALMDMDAELGTWQFKVYEVASADLAKAREAAQHIERRPTLRIPESELKGVLSTTFEMDEFEQDTAFPVGSHILQTEHILSAKETRDVDA